MWLSAISMSVLNPSDKVPPGIFYFSFKDTSEKIAAYLLHDVLAFWLLADATGSLFSTG